MSLLDEHSGFAAIQEMLLVTDSAKLAVAFWGTGAAGRLGLARPGLSLHILCNLESGACNPAEIRLLQALPNVEIKSHAALHAKIYWTPAAAVVGSSNASANGLAVDGEDASAWAEANVRLKEPAMLGEIERRFDTLFEEAHEISGPDLKRAETLWASRRKLVPTGRRAIGDLLAAYAQAPGHPVWNQVKLAFCSDPLADEDEAWLEAEQAAGRIDPDISAYSDWNDRIAPGDWILDFDMDERPIGFSAWRARPEHLGRPNLRLVREINPTAVRFAAFGTLRINKADAARLAGLAPQVLARHGDPEGRNALIPLSLAMAILEATARIPDERGFAAAMDRIYDEAAAIDYYPNEFRRMVHTLGAVKTARQLIRGKATTGFTRLWEEGRLDLSVEWLILRPEWQPLFSAEEHAIARRRLAQYHYPDEA